jgi:hypothetical protein
MIWLTIPAALLALLAALVALRHWMASPARVLDEIEALTDVPAHIKADLLDCIDAAQDADRKTWLYDLSAPLVMLLVLPFVPRSADKLPRAFRKWDNDVSMNGDGWGWQDSDGQWYDTRVRPAPEGKLAIAHSDPAYGGDCYYAKGHHPRSFWARYIWLGWRNRASLMSLELGEQVTATPVLISGSMAIHRGGPYGHFLLKHEDCYHYKSIRLWHGWALTRSYGYKLEIAYHMGRDTVAAVAIGRSLKRARA